MGGGSEVAAGVGGAVELGRTLEAVNVGVSADSCVDGGRGVATLTAPPIPAHTANTTAAGHTCMACNTEKDC